MSEEKKEKKKRSGPLRAAQFIFGVAVIGFAVYGWKMMGMDGFFMFIVGATGFSICTYSLGLESEWY
jgi:hypothetical protein